MKMDTHVAQPVYDMKEYLSKKIEHYRLCILERERIIDKIINGRCCISRKRKKIIRIYRNEIDLYKSLINEYKFRKDSVLVF